MNISINKQQLALYLIVLSLPLNWFGIVNFEPGGKSSGEALLFAIAFTAGLTMFCGGIYMAFKYKQGREEFLHASQTKVGSSSILDNTSHPLISGEPVLTSKHLIEKTINKKQKEKKMSEEVRVQNTPQGRSSVNLLQREKELKAEEKDLNFQLEQIRLEKVGIEQELQAKGWIRNYEREWDVPTL